MAKKAANAESKKPKSASRAKRTFPACAFEDAIEIAVAIQKYAAGQKVRRLTLFDQIGKAPDSGPSRSMVTNARNYGLIKGNYGSEHLELTVDGAAATADDAAPRERAVALAKLAVQSIQPFNVVYERFVNNKVPSHAVLGDAMKEAGVAESLVDEAVDTFVVNAKYSSLLQTLSGAERFITVEHLLDSLPTIPAERNARLPATDDGQKRALITSADANFATTCFYITPIGSSESAERQHSDLFLGSIVEPAVEQFDMKVVRADAIEKPGLITKQVIEFLLKSRLVIADLSYHNPNVFYELAIRHAARLPTVQITRSADKLPFDVNQNRTVHIDTETIYTLVPKLDTYKSQIASQIRRALDDPDATDNPITLFWPSLKVSI